MSGCLFCDILSGDKRSGIVYEDEHIAAFEDINPQAPVHVLVLPKRHYTGLNDAPAETSGRCIEAARRIASEKGIDNSGYRVVANCGSDGGQTVGHLHFHLLGGRRMKWPPG